MLEMLFSILFDFVPLCSIVEVSHNDWEGSEIGHLANPYCILFVFDVGLSM